MIESKCPCCGGEMLPEFWFDEEGVEAWRCEDCEWGNLGSHDEPPSFTEGWGDYTVDEWRLIHP